MLVTFICWAAVVLEGYDLISYGTVLPVLLGTPGSGFTPTTGGLVGSAAFAGMLVGALASGWVSDRVGRKPVVIGSLVWFSVFTVLCAFATGPVSLGLLRIVGGIGLGGIVPAASALTLEHAAPRHRTLAYTLMLSGVPIGGVLAALAGIPVLPLFGWQFMFVLGAVPAAFVLPLAWRKLPESTVFRRDTDQVGLFGRGYLAASLLFAAATFFGLLAWFGLGTWLPGMMRADGYEVGYSLVFLLVLNLGAVAGSLVIAAAADRWGGRLIVVGTYVMMALMLLLLLVKLPQPPLLAAIALAGVGGHGGQILVNAFVSRSYPANCRARALGWSLGVGRAGTVVGPALIGVIVAGNDPRLGFGVFAGSALCAAILLLLVPRTPAVLGASTDQLVNHDRAGSR